jgi:sulfite oxidase
MEQRAPFIVHSSSPFNAEPPLDLLRANFITPRELFYVRNHGNVPEIDAAAFRLVVEGMVERPLELTLDRLQNDFPRRTVMATLECAGNRRNELTAIAPTPEETPWQAGAIGNAFWSGVPLKELLNAAGVKLGAQYVEFQGIDDVIRKDKHVGFGGSIALDKAWSDEVLLAHEMNGKPLEPMHGYPLRALVPGYIGARSVKWLTRITVQAAPSQNYFQAHAYQLFPPQVSAQTADWTAGLQLGELAVNCVITSPRQDAQISRDLTVEGYALSSGGRQVARVDVSADGGASWTTARLTHGAQSWTWTFWEVKLQLEQGMHGIVARAFDTASNTQPEDARHIWNFKGYMNNAWHRIHVRVA